MKKLERFIIAVVILFAFSIVALAEEANYDFSLSDVTYDADTVEELALLQGEEAEEYNNSLGACKTLNYETTVEEGIKKLDTITVETSRERDNVIEEKEEEGYTVEVTTKKHDAAVLDYEFETLNGTVSSATINGNDTTSYNGNDIDDILESTEFEDYEDDDVEVKNEVTNNIENISESEIVPTTLAAIIRANQLSSQGYGVNVSQNNYQYTVTTIRTTRTYNGFQIRDIAQQAAQNANPNKEIRNLMVLPYTTETETETFNSEDEANAYADQLRNSGDYASVEVQVVINTNSATRVKEKVADPQGNAQTGEYDEDVYTDNEVTGYRHHYIVSEESTTTETENIGSRPHRTLNGCEDEIRTGSFPGYSNIRCERTGNGYNSQYVVLGDITRTITIDTPYYDEYEYAKSFNVVATYYEYTVRYIATDYTVAYRGTAGNVSIIKSSADKYFELDAERPEYTVSTTGTVEEDTTCLKPKTINTGVEENAMYEIIALVASIGLITLVVKKYRKAN